MFGASATIVVGRLLASGASLAVVAWLTQALTQADLGRYAVIITIANVGSIVSDMGQRLYLTRHLPMVTDVGPVLRRSMLLVSGVATTLGLAWIAVGAPFDGLGRTAIGAAIMGLGGFIFALSGALAGTGRVVWAGLSLQAARPLVSLISLVIVAGVATIDVDAALLAQLGTVAAIVAGSALGLLTPRTPPGDGADLSTRRWITASLPLVVMGGLGMLSSQVDILVVRGLDSADAAGLYYNAAALALVPSYALQGANTVIMPQVARAWAEGRVDDVHAVLGQSLRFAIAGAVPAIVGVVVAYRLGVDYGWTFAEGVPILGVLMIGQVVNVACGSVGITLLMCGYERLVASTYAAALVINIVVSMALVPLAGPIGAAVGTAAAGSVWNIWLVANLRRRIGVDTSVARRLLGRPRISGRDPTPSS